MAKMGPTYANSVVNGILEMLYQKIFFSFLHSIIDFKVSMFHNNIMKISGAC